MERNKRQRIAPLSSRPDLLNRCPMGRIRGFDIGGPAEHKAVMELRDSRDGWTISLRGGRVQMIQIDFRLSLLISDGTDEAWLHIETRSWLRAGPTKRLLEPGQSESLAPILPFFNATVENIEITKSGRLTVRFQKDSYLAVEADAAYEAWQVGCSRESRGFLLVCPPGGEVAVFNDNGALTKRHIPIQ